MVDYSKWAAVGDSDDSDDDGAQVRRRPPPAAVPKPSLQDRLRALADTEGPEALDNLDKEIEALKADALRQKKAGGAKVGAKALEKSGETLKAKGQVLKDKIAVLDKQRRKPDEQVATRQCMQPVASCRLSFD